MRIQNGGQTKRLKHTMGAVIGTILFLSLQHSAVADSVAWTVLNSDDFGKTDLSTGVYTEVGNMGVLLGGLGEIDGKLYGGAPHTGDLYEIDKSNGTITKVGTGSISYFPTGSTIGALFALGDDLNLYSIDPSNGASTLIGPTGLTGTCGASLSSGSGTLYLSAAGPCGSYASSLYSLNTLTGAATLIGPIGSDTGSPPMVWENNKLYAGINFPTQQVCTLNVTSGSPNCFVGASGARSYFYGFAPASTPEPSSLILLGTGLLGFAASLRRRSQSKL